MDFLRRRLLRTIEGLLAFIGFVFILEVLTFIALYARLLDLFLASVMAPW